MTIPAIAPIRAVEAKAIVTSKIVKESCGSGDRRNMFSEFWGMDSHLTRSVSRRTSFSHASNGLKRLKTVVNKKVTREASLACPLEHPRL